MPTSAARGLGIVEPVISDPRPLTVNADRLLPAEPAVRAIARELYGQVRDLPIVSPHGHVPARWLADDVRFDNPTSLLITPDHYVTRLLHSSGVRLDQLGVGAPGEPGAGDGFTEAKSRKAFRLFCERWPLFAGTHVEYWLRDQLVQIFDVHVRPSARTADDIYDAVAAWIAAPGSTARRLLTTFNIDVLATTDDPCDSLEHHEKVRSLTPARVVPTLRPDAYLEPANADWNERTDRLAEVSGGSTDSYAGWVAAMEDRRAYFTAHGAVSTDHAHADLGTQRLDPSEAEALYGRARRGAIATLDADRLRRHMVGEMVRMAADDGLTMTLHPAVARNHHRPTHARFGADVGSDIPVAVEVTRALAPALNAHGTNPNLHLVVFTIDETVYSRELAPLAGFYPSLFIGAPWWFLDAPGAIRRFQEAVTDSAGFSRLSGFIDDTRAFCSIPARHDMSRRLDAAHLARLVAEHRLEPDQAEALAHQLVVDQPRKVFKL